MLKDVRIPLSSIPVFYDISKQTRTAVNMSIPIKASSDTKSPQSNTTEEAMHSQQQSPLLQLPMELQLAIYEYAVIENESLYVNCGCDSSYASIAAWNEDQALWEDGRKHPPVQPGLTRTCQLVRALSLPIYYQRNAFRAHYCYEADLSMAIKWLKSIGQANRELMPDLAMLDVNPSFDFRVPNDIKKVGRSAIVREMGGRMQTEDRNPRDCCMHRVVFGLSDDEYYESVATLFRDDSEM